MRGFMQYKYRCKQCNTEFEIVASFATISLLTVYCPVCMTDEVKRVYTIPSIKFNGKGFYITDNRKDETNGRN
jgi:putative FmdB family regulatory protein